MPSSCCAVTPSSSITGEHLIVREESVLFLLVTFDKALEVLKELDVLLMLNSSTKLYELIRKGVVDPTVSQEVHEVVVKSLKTQQREYFLTAILCIVECYFNKHLLRSLRKTLPSQESLCSKCNWSPSTPYLPQAGN